MVMNVTSRCSRAGAEALRQELNWRQTPEIPSGPALCCCAARRSPLAGSPAGCPPSFPRTSSPGTRCRGHRGRRSAASARRGPRSERIKPSPPRSRSPSGQTSANWCVIRPALNPHAPPQWPAAQARATPAVRGDRPQTSPTARVDANNLLDIWRRHDLAPGSRAPVLIQVPGGAWAVNGKRVQAYTLMSHMVELGWICVSINYSKSPRCAFPAHIIDVKRAIAWVRENIADYGGDPDFIAITGGSAGGHLASLAALTPNDPSVSARVRRRRHDRSGGRRRTTASTTSPTSTTCTK